jgi:hypothetical protein
VLGGRCDRADARQGGQRGQLPGAEIHHVDVHARRIGRAREPQGDRLQCRCRAAATDAVEQQVAGVEVPAEWVLSLGLRVVGQAQPHHRAEIPRDRPSRSQCEQPVEVELVGERLEPRPSCGRGAGGGLSGGGDEPCEIRAGPRRVRRAGPSPIPGCPAPAAGPAPGCTRRPAVPPRRERHDRDGARRTLRAGAAHERGLRRDELGRPEPDLRAARLGARNP